MSHSHQRLSELALPHDLQGSFIGFIIKAILFGIEALQAFQYFRDYRHDSRRRKLMIVTVCSLETIHFITSARMMYASLDAESPSSELYAVWCIKILATVKTLITVLVQSFYLHLIWVFDKRSVAENLTMKKNLTRTIRSFSVFVFTMTIGVSGVFIAYLEQVSTMFNFPIPFQRVTAVSMGSAAATDCFIAVMMSIILYQSSPRTRDITRSTAVVRHLVIFFILSGIINAVPKIMIIVLYATNPSSILYLSAQFAVPSLCANSILALFNAKSKLRERMNNFTVELKISSALLFGEPLDEISRTPGHGNGELSSPSDSL